MLFANFQIVRNYYNCFCFYTHSSPFIPEIFLNFLIISFLLPFSMLKKYIDRAVPSLKFHQI